MRNNRSIRQAGARVARGVGIGVALCLLSACTTVQPWDREILAKKSMALNTHPNLTGFREHTYFSKEATSGGRSFDGGGCGCN